jgi:Tol biopolymer transport system component/DNA-binding winged helix-turn-helix (wHTH) protein
MPLRFREGSTSPSPRPQRIAFDNFEVDLRSGEVRKHGHRIRLQPQPFQLLVLLLENAGEVVTREEISRHLWPADTFVDFEHGLAAAVNKIRDALGDTADNPKYIETFPKRGYRFIGKLRPEAPVVIGVPDPPHAVELVPVPLAKVWRSSMWIPGLVGIMVLLITVALFVRPSRKSLYSPPDSLMNSSALMAVPFTAYPGVETAPSFSPDGSRIVFSWDNATGKRSGRPQFDLYVKAIGSESLLRLTNHPSDWISSTWSPDGTRIAFHRLADDDNGIYVVPALGGPERKLLSTQTPYDVAAPISWSPDGKWIAYSDWDKAASANRNFLLNVETLETHQFPHDPSCRHDGGMTFPHSGKELAIVCVHNTFSFEYLITDLQGKSQRSLALRHEYPHGLAWSGDDQSLIVAAANAGGVEFYEIRVTDGEVHTLPVAAGAWPAISNDGHKLAFSLSDDHVNIWRKDLQHPEAPAVQMYASTRPQSSAQYSPDGRHIAFDSMRSGTWSVWLADSDGGNLVQITQGLPARYPRWSPDSRKITFQMTEPSGFQEVYTADISDHVAHKLKTNVRESANPYWSHDGKWIYFLGREGTGHQLFRCPAEGGEVTLLVDSMEVTNQIESSDGKLLYFPLRFSEANMMTLALDRPGAAPQQLPQMARIFDQSKWAVVPGGIYFAPRDHPRSICFYDFVAHRTRELFKADKDLAEGMSVSPDGRYLLYSQLDESSSAIMLVNYLR